MLQLLVYTRNSESMSKHCLLEIDWGQFTWFITVEVSCARWLSATSANTVLSWTRDWPQHCFGILVYWYTCMLVHRFILLYWIDLWRLSNLFAISSACLPISWQGWDATSKLFVLQYLGECCTNFASDKRTKYAEQKPLFLTNTSLFGETVVNLKHQTFEA